MIQNPHTLSPAEALEGLGTSHQGLQPDEVEARRERYGKNVLPSAPPTGLLTLFLRQFASPLIYVLLGAALLSLAIGHITDALFIGIVLLVNAGLGSGQEYGAERSAQALKKLLAAKCDVRRGGEDLEIDVEELVPGDLVTLETGDKVPADLRLLSANGLSLQEALLTGESLPIPKSPDLLFSLDVPLGDRKNMAFAGTLVSQGRGLGVVTATGAFTQLGLLAQGLAKPRGSKPPLLERLERFSTLLTYWMMGFILAIGIVYAVRGYSWVDILLASVALAVSAIPEGLPVAITVALSVAVRRMSRRNVIVRRLVAVESLGSCTCIASDKTGTLSLNELTVKRLAFPGLEPLEVTGAGIAPEGSVVLPPDAEPGGMEDLVERLSLAAVLCNEGFLGKKDGGWIGRGDPLDVALLAMAHKAGLTRAGALSNHEPFKDRPFESEHMYAASLYRTGPKHEVFVKGALEKVLPMCASMRTLDGARPLAQAEVRAQGETLASQGYRVIALASGPLAPGPDPELSPQELKGLHFLGLAGILDPLRERSKDSIEACRRAGIRVVMLTGDHPLTALAIARQLHLAQDPDEVVSGPQLKEALEKGEGALDGLTRDANVFARVEPAQKYEIIRSLARHGHFTAVTGDGANDAPALKAAHVGVAMGRSGTDVARESADIVLLDDKFSSIVAGVEEGRLAYANIRKVILLLLATGMSEIALFCLALAFDLPIPLTAVQLLWLNLVTNGIQHVGLSFEPSEGDELKRPPRPPKEPIFNRLMIERCCLAALWIGTACFLLFRALLAAGLDLDAARNMTLLLMVLFENFQVGNCRSEFRSAFAFSPFRNPLLLFGTLGAQGLHILAMHIPPLQGVLGVAPVAPGQWSFMLLLGASVVPVVELHKAWISKRKSGISNS